MCRYARVHTSACVVACVDVCVCESVSVGALRVYVYVSEDTWECVRVHACKRTCACVDGCVC